MRKIVVLSIYYIRWSNASAWWNLRKIHQAVSNMAVGFHLTGDEMLLIRSWKKQMKPADLLLGRKTFEIFASYWPEHEKWMAGYQ